MEREADKKRLIALAEEMGLLAGHMEAGDAASNAVTGEVHNALVGLVALTPCKLFVLSQEDLFKDCDQQNLPGTTNEYPNWSLKMKYSVEDLATDRNARGFSEMFRAWVHRTGRAPQERQGGGS